MLKSSVQKRISTDEERGKAPGQFSGFQPLTGNTTYTPNQFFDVCIRHSSRGGVRLVGYLIRKTLGWCDKTGNPQEDQIRTSYADLIRNAGISRDMIRKALDEATQGNFIECARTGKKSRAGESSQTALHQLRWDAADIYQKKPGQFRGFFEGEGNRTYIPNEFFDVVVANENLSVIKVVGAIMRSSIGFESRRGYRRQNVALSYKDIQNFTRIKSRRTLSDALKTALARRYIVRIDEGVFSPDKSKQQSAVYAPCWADSLTGQIWIPEAQDRSEKDTSRKRIPGNRSDSDSRRSQIIAPEKQSEKDTTFKITQINKTNHKPDDSVLLLKKRLLEEEGINRRVARTLAQAHSLEEIQRQISWIDARNPKKSRAGLLMRSIQQSWAAPSRHGRDESRDANPSKLRQCAEEAIRKRHKARFIESYIEFLLSEESRIKADAPEDYERFATARNLERARLGQQPWTTPESLEKFDSPHARLLALRQSFRLRSFWDWDRSLNPKSFDSLAARLLKFEPGTQYPNGFSDSLPS